jgi:hypothetical protein
LLIDCLRSLHRLWIADLTKHRRFFAILDSALLALGLSDPRQSTKPKNQSSRKEKNMRGAKLLFRASWILLLALSGILVLYSLVSLQRAYFSAQDYLYIGENGSARVAVGIEEIKEKGGEGAVKAYRGRRATASSMAIGCGLMSAFLIFFAYRRGEKWAWWALLVSLGLSQFLSLGRLLTLGSAQGASAAGIVLAPLLLGLLAGVPYMFFRRMKDVVKEA